MATEILAIGTTAATSSDVVVVAGTPKTVFLKDAAGPSIPADAVMLIQVKDDAGAYFDIGRLGGGGPIAVMLEAPGTYRLSRPASSASCGACSA